MAVNISTTPAMTGLGLRRDMLDELSLTMPQDIDFFEVAPESVKDAVLAPESIDVLDEIAKKYGLTKEQYRKMGRYVDFVLVGVVPIKLFRETLEEEMEVDTETARKIAGEIRDKIFMKVKDELRKIHGL